MRTTDPAAPYFLGEAVADVKRCGRAVFTDERSARSFELWAPAWLRPLRVVRGVSDNGERYWMVRRPRVVRPLPRSAEGERVMVRGHYGHDYNRANCCIHCKRHAWEVLQVRTAEGWRCAGLVGA